MNIKFLVTGKTADSYIREGILEYQQRLSRYVNFEMEELIIKGNPVNRELQLEKEGLKILTAIKSTDFMMLLDEKGEQFTSENFSAKMASFQLNGTQRIVFVCGGAYGFNEKVYQRANGQLSLSKMTFTHQMVRLLFIEQLYRAYTILRNEKYHH